MSGSQQRKNLFLANKTASKESSTIDQSEPSGAKLELSNKIILVNVPLLHNNQSNIEKHKEKIDNQEKETEALRMTQDKNRFEFLRTVLIDSMSENLEHRREIPDSQRSNYGILRYIKSASQSYPCTLDPLMELNTSSLQPTTSRVWHSSNKQNSGPSSTVTQNSIMETYSGPSLPCESTASGTIMKLNSGASQSNESTTWNSLIEFNSDSSQTLSTQEASNSIMEPDSDDEMLRRTEVEAARGHLVAFNSDDCPRSRPERERWSEDAKLVVYSRFRDFIKHRKGPGLKKCRELIELQPELFRGRTPPQMSSLISNWILGKSELPSHDFMYDSDNELKLNRHNRERETVRSSPYFPKNRWSSEAKKLVITAFVDCIKKGINPGHERCRCLIRQNPTLLQGRTPIQLNLLVDNWLRGKTEPPAEFRYLFPEKN